MSTPERVRKRFANRMAEIESRRTMSKTPADFAPIAKTERRRKQLAADAALAKAAFEASTTPETRERIRCSKGFIAVVSVPDTGWVAPISAHIASLTDAKRIARSGSDKLKDLPSEGNEQVLLALADGRSVFGISQAPQRYLPSVLVASADFQIRVGPPDGATLARAMVHALGGRAPKNVPDDLGSGRDFNELAAALRPGSSPADAVRRLTVIAKARSGTAVGKLPSLEDAIFYGGARDWGLALAADVGEAKQTGDWSGVDRGAVFHGEPGTGKTWLARMIAQACGLPIVESSVADLFGSSAGYLDSVVKAQRAVFARAMAAAPCVLFFDEIEAMPNRATLSPRGRDWWLPVVDDFLLLVSSVPEGVILLGATNHLDLVDAALLRPGRLERAIEIRPPSTGEGLAAVLRFQLGDDLAGEDLVPLARMGVGATAAVAMEWVRRARRTARAAKRKIVLDDLATVIAPPDGRPPEIRKQAAMHEAAHAVVAVVLGAEELRSVSIVADGKSGGHMRTGIGASLEARGRDHFEKVAIATLAGRAAEKLFFGTATAGAGGHPNSDLAIVTRIVTAIHASLGLGDSLLYRGEPTELESALLYDSALRAAVDADIKKLHVRADALVGRHRTEIEAVAEALLHRRHLSGEDVKNILHGARGEEAPNGGVACGRATNEK